MLFEYELAIISASQIEQSAISSPSPSMLRLPMLAALLALSSGFMGPIVTAPRHSQPRVAMMAKSARGGEALAPTLVDALLDAKGRPQTAAPKGDVETQGVAKAKPSKAAKRKATKAAKRKLAKATKSAKTPTPAKLKISAESELEVEAAPAPEVEAPAAPKAKAKAAPKAKAKAAPKAKEAPEPESVQMDYTARRAAYITRRQGGGGAPALVKLKISSNAAPAAVPEATAPLTSAEVSDFESKRACYAEKRKLTATIADELAEVEDAAEGATKVPKPIGGYAVYMANRAGGAHERALARAKQEAALQDMSTDDVATSPEDTTTHLAKKLVAKQRSFAELREKRSGGADERAKARAEKEAADATLTSDSDNTTGTSLARSIVARQRPFADHLVKHGAGAEERAQAREAREPAAAANTTGTSLARSIVARQRPFSDLMAKSGAQGRENARQLAAEQPVAAAPDATTVNVAAAASTAKSIIENQRRAFNKLRSKRSEDNKEFSSSTEFGSETPLPGREAEYAEAIEKAAYEEEHEVDAELLEGEEDNDDNVKAHAAGMQVAEGEVVEPALNGIPSRAAGRAPAALDIDDERRGRSPGIQHNFYDIPTADFKKPHTWAKGGHSWTNTAKPQSAPGAPVQDEEASWNHDAWFQSQQAQAEAQQQAAAAAAAPGPARAKPAIDDERQRRSPGIEHNFYDIPTADFKKPHTWAKGGHSWVDNSKPKPASQPASAPSRQPNAAAMAAAAAAKAAAAKKAAAAAAAAHAAAQQAAAQQAATTQAAAAEAAAAQAAAEVAAAQAAAVEASAKDRQAGSVVTGAMDVMAAAAAAAMGMGQQASDPKAPVETGSVDVMAAAAQVMGVVTPTNTNRARAPAAKGVVVPTASASATPAASTPAESTPERSAAPLPKSALVLLDELGLAQYEQAFRSEDLTETIVFTAMLNRDYGAADLRDILSEIGMSVGHRERVMLALTTRPPP